ncbi:MAG: radical SAM family heme chaperone HemW [Bacteroidia bacterium]
MPTLYIHIPFCRQACTYCDFHFITSLRQKTEMVQAIADELILRKDFFRGNNSLRSIYFGGGTPSVLESSEIALILEAAGRHFSIEPEAEITLEANPDDLSREKLRQLRHAGINRLSVGIQSFEEKDLQLMNRSHSASQAVQSLHNALGEGFSNISADLIFGIPGQSLQEWEQHLLQLISLGVPHISLYALTVEEKTALAFQVKKRQTILPEDDFYAKQFLLAHDLLTSHGYAHYELSNYALPGFRSQHNSAYWEQIAYLGLGPSAHSFDGTQRMWNVANNQHYLTALNTGQTAIAETEILTLRDQYHEYIMTHLRKADGIDSQLIENQLFRGWEDTFSEEIRLWTAEGKMIKTPAGYRLSPEGWLVSDHIIRDFFMD